MSCEHAADLKTIRDQVSTLSTRVDGMSGLVGACPLHTESMRELKRDVSEILNTLSGVGNNKGPGLMTRVALLEEVVRDRKWLERAVIVAGLAMVANVGAFALLGYMALS